ncbi:carnitine transport ATP-binding protein OpuCA [Clostridium pasteurianum DSM 525 = ATCC 6013]|uniref:Quaternary amine transport ATP-binding protein n=1 Tax=Clostridium pasteurianum DSM 525 = ATCC 6013 TaxID=1262449 RepID=A0A0H3J7G5_CLOPA|nr:carnitine transport ATP-binding protein OpuCA [Clostridium pasteurianum DSM 525 = ATCC 6013]AOZ80801.1 proline/glycine betaine ABC transporter ATP-binding protein [Clostridium pasteurianum]AJA53849.1 carnitine transport ATP-binding protein OpuCA [Clostridium pasteurianum DSM 525 = ATCC 6013]AOZ77004.1 proline/glycine betaine ABC transporter ATP-binding protein [Clostridium pasteurianum DSM 525 = ATCC 6013]ELP57821.1 ABC transporter ATPase [Clostridium pasteurianum DSM 525 = ATCC 6013]
MIEFKGINKIINGKKILRDINIKIEKGELVTFIGPSGCGKTTTLKMINKLIKPTSGEILINRNRIEEENTIKLRRSMGYVIQQTGLLPHLNVKENIELIPSIEKVPKGKVDKRTEELLKLVDMEPKDYLYKYPSELSGGQQQRVGIARAFAMDPEIILMDEPFSALDPITRCQLQDEVFNIQQNIKKTIVFVTHDMDEALKLADKICIMEAGRVVQFDTPENVLRNPINDFVKNFIGANRIWNQPELIKVKDIMIENPVKSSAERTVIQAIEIMKYNHVDSLLIVNKDNTLNGIITLKEIRASTNRNTKLKDIMETKVITVNYEESILNVLETIEKESIGYVPAVDNDSKLVGLITKSSLLSVLSDQLMNKEVEA